MRLIPVCRDLEPTWIARTHLANLRVHLLGIRPLGSARICCSSSRSPCWGSIVVQQSRQNVSRRTSNFIRGHAHLVFGLPAFWQQQPCSFCARELCGHIRGRVLGLPGHSMPTEGAAQVEVRGHAGATCGCRCLLVGLSHVAGVARLRGSGIGGGVPALSGCIDNGLLDAIRLCQRRQRALNVADELVGPPSARGSGPAWTRPRCVASASRPARSPPTMARRSTMSSRSAVRSSSIGPHFQGEGD